MKPNLRDWAWLALILLVPLAPLPAQEGPPRLRVGAASGAIDLDGRLQEPAWRSADSIAALTMTDPVEGGSTVGRTAVWVLADARNLYVGVRAYDPDPEGIVSFSKQRDPQLRGEDHIILVLDTYLDGRSGYTFGLNPTGARYDALVAGSGERQSDDWDGVWEARTHIDADGWSAEFRIPVATLAFREGLEEWGFNIQRRVERLQEEARWASPRRDYQVTQVSRAGRITNLPDFDLGLGLTVRPSLVAGAGVPEPEAQTDERFEPSLDVTQRLGANLLASLTVNTDFAETEVDTRQTNLTRFALFFPEKRTFFLEGSDVFRFGFGLGHGLLPFHSRKIGLVQGEPVPLRVGGKVNGRVGDTNLGFLAVRTGAEQTLAPATEMAVARVHQNVWEESTLGFLGTLGDPLGRTDAWMAGVDFTYRTSSFLGNKNLILAAWGLANGRADLEGDRSAVGVAFDWPNDLWDVYLSYKRIGDAFDPSLGFVPRKGIHDYQAFFTWLPRPEWDWLRYMRNEIFGSLTTDLTGRWESYRVFTAPFNWIFESGDRFEFNIVSEGEQLPEPFRIAEGVEIPVGDYHWVRYKLEADLASKRPVNGRVMWWWGDFYEGTLTQYEGSVNFNPSATLNFELSGTRNVGELPRGDFAQNLVGVRTRVNVSPDLQVTAFVQYDNESETVGSNSRLRWTFHPRGELFVVYNHNLRDLTDRWRKESNELVVKVQYAFRY